MSIELSSDQKYALNLMQDWFSNPNGVLKIGGVAGSGKSTLIAEFRKGLRKNNPRIRVAVCTYTAKAAQVLREKFQYHKCIYDTDSIGTIHSLIYRNISKTNTPQFILKENIDCDLIILDEASMVDSSLLHQMQHFSVPIMAVGDFRQLKPISKNNTFFESLDFELTSILRQSAESPIIKLSILAREEGKIPAGKFSKNVVKFDAENVYDNQEFFELLSSSKNKDLVLAATNNTRTKMNTFIRQERGFDTTDLSSQDKIVFLSNHHDKEIFNGQLGIISRLHNKNGQTLAQINWDDYEIYDGPIEFGENVASKNTKHPLLTFGYCLTVHKAQGSSSKRVFLLEEQVSKMSNSDYATWLYTAITRSSSDLFILGRNV